MKVVCQLSVAGLLLLATMWSGCTPTSPAPGAGPAATSDASLGDADAGDAGESDAFAELSAEDQALAKAQKVCPIGGDLGSMGTPVKVEVEGKPYFLCCEGCREPFLKEPDKYIAALAEKAAKAE